MSYKEEIQKMFTLQKFGMKFGLDNMRRILSDLGDPHQGRKYVHVAGTNGKGSVAATLASILMEAGFTVGVYTSPHLITFRERITINGRMISEEEVLALAAELWPLFPQASDLPTFFEFVTAMALLYFQRQGVDLAILEAGLGGRLDSTNVIMPLAGAITNISLEHTEHLGDTVEKIAREKAGIIKPDRPLVVGPTPPEAAAPILEEARKQRAGVIMHGRDYQISITAMDGGRPVFDLAAERFVMRRLRSGLAGRHQAANVGVAVNLAYILMDEGFKLTEAHLRQGVENTRWAGRGERRAEGQWPPSDRKARAPLMLDGAHNPAGAQALAALLGDLDYEKLHLILGVMADKDVAGVLSPLLARADELYLTRPDFYRAAAPELLRQKIEAALGPLTIPHALYPRLPEAIRAAADRAGRGDLVVVSGSLFTVGEARAFLDGLSEVESN